MIEYTSKGVVDHGPLQKGDWHRRKRIVSNKVSNIKTDLEQDRFKTGEAEIKRRRKYEREHFGGLIKPSVNKERATYVEERFKPGPFYSYYYIDKIKGIVCSDKWKSTIEDYHRYDRGNVYRTEEAALKFLGAKQ